jgi:hypothetical protein
MVLIRSRMVCAALSVLALAGCASSPVVGGGPAHRAGTSATTNTIAANSSTPTWGCDGNGAGFAVSRAIGGHGAPTPIAAAHDFALHGGVPGYGTPISVWTVTAHGQGEATLVSGKISLHALQMRDGTWWIDSGKRCG